MLKTSVAKDTVHQWLEDYITPPSSVTFSAEGAAATYSGLTQPSRILNLTAILTETFRVSGTERAANPGGGQDPLDYQAGKALRTWKMKEEYAIVNGALSSGVSGTAASMAGLINVITTLYTARNSGTSLSETEFQDMHQQSWEKGGTDNAFDLVLVPFGLKRKIDGFTAGATKYVDQSDKKLTQSLLPFQEMRQEIKRLKTEKETREKSESAFNVFRPTIPPVGQPGPVRVEDFQDSLTGETNWTAYNQAVNDALIKTRQLASFEAQQSTQELIDENNARNKFPEVFADPEAEEEIASRYLFYKMRGDNVSISDIAGRIAKRYNKAVSKAEKIGAEKALNEVTEKESAGLSASAQTSQPARSAESEEDYERLRVKTRMGDDDAIAARISKIPWANK